MGPGHQRGNTQPPAAPFEPGRPVFVVGEAGSNWRAGELGGDEARAHALIDAAADAACDAVKFQVFRAETIYAPHAGESDYLSAAGIREDILAILAALEMPYSLVGELAAHARERNLEFMATAFSVVDARAVDPFVRIHKIASYELSHLRLIEFLAATKKPLLISTGAATEDVIARTLALIRELGGGPPCLNQCTAAYPAPPDSVNLRAIPAMAARFGVAVGLSDHSADPIAAPTAAVALGARAIEKHFTLDRKLPGPDHAYAVEPDELAAMVRAIRLIEKMLGTGKKVVQPAEEELFHYSLRGLQATREIAAGEELREGENFDILRPGKNRRGLNPFDIALVEGRRAARAIKAGEGIRAEDLA